MKNNKKKKIIILLIIIGVPIVLSIGTAVFVPGLPIYIIYKDKFPNAYIQLTEFDDYDVHFDSDTQTQLIEIGDITAHIPADFYFQHERAYPIAYRHEDNNDLLFSILPLPQEEFNLVENVVETADKKGINEKDALRMFTSLGIEPPETRFDFLYTTHALAWDNFNIKSFTNSMSFMVLALGKEVPYSSLLFSREQYYYENEYIKGFIYAGKDEENSELTKYICDFFYTDDGNKSFIIIIYTQDNKTAYSFINSIRT